MARRKSIALTFYCVVGVVTFGHAAAHTCNRAIYPCISGDRAMAGLIAAPFWPLYWSWELFDEGAE